MTILTTGGRLRQLREEKKLGQKEIASILGMSDSGYSCYENDIRIPTTQNLIKLAEFYNVTTDFILGIDGKYMNVNDVSKRVQALEKQISEFKSYIENYKQP